MKVRTNDLTDKALDWAVTTCNASDAGALVHLSGFIRQYKHGVFRYSTDPAQGHPIIEREGISVVRCDDEYGTDRQGFTTSKRIPVWAAEKGQQGADDIYGSQGDNWGRAYSIHVDHVTYGPTALVAGLRCYVTYKLGDEVEIPEELL